MTPAAAFQRLLAMPWRPVALCLAGACLCACAPPAWREKSVSHALAAVPAGGLSGRLERAAAARPGQSGFALLDDPGTALADRVALIAQARRTLDVQYYIWTGDSTGSLLGEQLIRAAERGVRVRVLLDDMNLRVPDTTLAAIAAHPQIELRVFNPHRFRSARAVEVLLDFARLNHRMHSKALIMDNACAIVGGRNIADEYFGRSHEFNMRDLDLLATGPVVREVSATFDEYWNCSAAAPVERLTGKGMGPADFQREAAVLREGVRRRAGSSAPMDGERVLADWRRRLESRQVWARAEVLHNPYHSLHHAGRRGAIAVRLGEELAAVRKSIHFEAAYFVPRWPGMKLLDQLRERGVEVRVLTNSLATNDVAAAQAGYANKRDNLLRAGVQLHELRPDAPAVRARCAPGAPRSARASLHTKAMVIDGRKCFVGSYNFDPRSAEINAEIALLVDSPELARRIGRVFAEGVRPENAFRLAPGPSGRPQWEAPVNGRPTVWTVPPETTGGRRLAAKLLGWLPIEDQL